MSNRVHFALIGCGKIAHKHATAIKRISRARLVAVCDAKSDRVADFALNYHARPFADFQTMMECMGEEIDVVSVLTPTGRHLSDVMAVTGCGKHVVVEKPMALTCNDAQLMIDSCQGAGVQLFVVKQNRYNRPVCMLHEAIRAGRFGKIVMATTRVRWSRDQAYYDRDKWRGTSIWDGGVFANQASHHLDLLLWLAGSVDSVFAYTKHRLAQIEVEDTGVSVFKFKSGALGIAEATTAARPKSLEASISILGERGSVVIGGLAVDELVTWQFATEHLMDKNLFTDYGRNPPGVFAYSHTEYLKDVVHCVVNNKPAVIDGHDGMRSVQLFNAIYESAKLGVPTFVADRIIPALGRTHVPTNAPMSDFDEHSRGDTVYVAN